MKQLLSRGSNHLCLWILIDFHSGSSFHNRYITFWNQTLQLALIPLCTVFYKFKVQDNLSEVCSCAWVFMLILYWSYIMYLRSLLCSKQFSLAHLIPEEYNVWNPELYQCVQVCDMDICSENIIPCRYDSHLSVLCAHTVY